MEQCVQPVLRKMLYNGRRLPLQEGLQICLRPVHQTDRYKSLQFFFAKDCFRLKKKAKYVIKEQEAVYRKIYRNCY